MAEETASWPHAHVDYDEAFLIWSKNESFGVTGTSKQLRYAQAVVEMDDEGKSKVLVCLGGRNDYAGGMTTYVPVTLTVDEMVEVIEAAVNLENQLNQA